MKEKRVYKAYKIWFQDQGQFCKKEIEVEVGGLFNEWINNEVCYDVEEKTDVMFCTEDRLEECERKLIHYLIKDQREIIRETREKVKSLEKILKSLDDEN